MSQQNEEKPALSYKDAGVDIEAGDIASRRAAMAARSTFRPEVIEQAGVALFDARFQNYRHPMLLGGSDGVGTKLKIAFMSNRHNTVGIDLVAMCVNDIIRRGGEPIVFLPYFATGKLDPEVASQVSEGVAEGCRRANCSIIGGETAEMPGFYAPGEYDIAGTAIGVVEKDGLITGESIRAGDIILGLASSGLHSNGYSLARRALLPSLQLNDRPLWLNGQTLADVLLEPTRIYVRAILAALRAGAEIHGLAHITGSGFRKLYKIIPVGRRTEISFGAWPIPPVFELIRQYGNVSETEMYETFNMGIGFTMVVPPSEANALTELLQKQGETVFPIGQII
jgi:phosphoribosylformylglycinamidine cyclo-ligase